MYICTSFKYHVAFEHLLLHSPSVCGIHMYYMYTYVYSSWPIVAISYVCEHDPLQLTPSIEYRDQSVTFHLRCVHTYVQV